MTRATRLTLAALCALLIVPAAAVVIIHMPAFGHHPLPYGDAINRATDARRHVTNMVTAVNFDYRAFDTLGEEIMLVAAVSGEVHRLGRGFEHRPGGTSLRGRGAGGVASVRAMAHARAGRADRRLRPRARAAAEAVAARR